jgi:hypothetical protein
LNLGKFSLIQFYLIGVKVPQLSPDESVKLFVELFEGDFLAVAKRQFFGPNY